MSITIMGHDLKATWVRCITRYVVKSTVHSVCNVGNVIQHTSSKCFSSFDIEHRHAVSSILAWYSKGTWFKSSTVDVL
jgi:hypothetical protein